MNTLFWIIIIMIIIALLGIAIFGKKSEDTDESTVTDLPSPHKGGEDMHYASSTVMQFGKNDKDELHYQPSNSHVGRINPVSQNTTSYEGDDLSDAITAAIVVAELLVDSDTPKQDDTQDQYQQEDMGVTESYSAPIESNDTYESRDYSSPSDNYSSSDSSSSDYSSSSSSDD